MDLFTDFDPFRIAGLPLHPLLVHATVVLTPLTALAVALGALWPAARRRLGVATPIAALLVAVLVPVTVAAGLNLAGIVGLTPAIQRHEALGLMLIPWSIALFLAALSVQLRERLVAVVERRSLEPTALGRGPLRRRGGSGARILSLAITALAVICAIGTLIVVVLTGDAGARAVWGGVG